MTWLVVGAWVLALSSMAVTCATLFQLARALRLMRSKGEGHAHETLGVIAVESRKTAETALVEVLRASCKNGLVIAVPRGGPPVSEAEGLRVVLAETDPRHACIPTMQAEALQRGACDEGAVVATWMARPSIQALSGLLQSIRGVEDGVLAAYPVSCPGDPVGARVSGLLAADAWVTLRAVVGPSALPAWHLAVVGPQAVQAALGDPLFRNRPSVAVAAALADGERPALLMPLPCPTADSTGPAASLRKVVAFASRVTPFGVAVWMISLLVLPALCVLAMEWPWGVRPLAVALAARLLVTLPWYGLARNLAAAVVAWLLAPLRDAVCFFMAGRALLRHQVLQCGRRFVLRRPGLLVPAVQEARGGVR